MGDEAANRVRHLLVRIALWSLISLPGFWVPLDSYNRYPDVDNRTGGVMCVSVPFLAVAAVLSIHALVELWRVLRSNASSHRCLLTLFALPLSAPTLAALAFMLFTIIRVTSQRP